MISSALTGVSGFTAPALAAKYDDNGNRTQLTIQNLSSQKYAVQSASYDALNRQSAVWQTADTTNGSGGTVTPLRAELGYRANGQLATVTRYASSTVVAANKAIATSYQYDSAGRLTQIKHDTPTSSLATVATYDYTYDLQGRLSHLGVAQHTAESADYSYDDTDQLTSADRSGTSGDESYSYDANGNRTGGNYGATYTVGGRNQIDTAGGYKYAYDKAGHLTSKIALVNGSPEGWTELLAWDNRGRLTQVTFKGSPSDSNESLVDYTYDVFDRRIAKSVDIYGTVQVTRFLYDLPSGPFAQKILQQYDGTSLSHRYLHGLAVDQVMADEQLFSGGEVIWPLADMQNTARDLVAGYGSGASGTPGVAVRNHLAYDSFGAVTPTASTLDYLFGYAGLEYDQETGLLHSDTRYYDSATGEWISEDPIGFAGGDTNLGRWVGNGATIYVDPTGLAVGHHYSNQATNKAFYSAGKLTKQAFEYLQKAVTGATVPHHNHSSYGGVSHKRYNELVNQALCDLYESLKAAGKLDNGQMTVSQAEAFIASLVKDGAGSKEILKFNTAVRKQIKVANIAKAMGGGAVLFAAVNDATEALAVVSTSKHFPKAVEALKNGELAKATTRMTSDNDSVFADLVDHNLPRAALSLRVWWDRAVKDAKALKAGETIP